MRGIRMDIVKKLKNFMENSRRVMNISYKPTMEEFRKTAKVVLIGIVIIGVAGFLIGTVLYFVTTGTLI